MALDHRISVDSLEECALNFGILESSQVSEIENVLLVGWWKETALQLPKWISGLISELLDESSPGIPTFVTKVRFEALN